MGNISFDFPIEEIVERFREVVKEEIAANFQKVPGGNVIDPPINTKQLCEFLSITEPTAIRWRKKGKIPFFEIGSAIRYNKSEVMDALKNNKKTR